MTPELRPRLSITGAAIREKPYEPPVWASKLWTTKLTPILRTAPIAPVRCVGDPVGTAVPYTFRCAAQSVKCQAHRRAAATLDGVRLLVNWPRQRGPAVAAFAEALDSAPAIEWASLDGRSAPTAGAGPNLVLDLGDEITGADWVRVTLSDAAGAPLYRSDRLRACPQELVEVVVGVHSPSDPPSFSRGFVRGHADPVQTLRGATAVLPLLIRKARAAPCLESESAPKLDGLDPTPPSRPTAHRGLPARLRAALDTRFRRTHWQVGLLETPSPVTQLLTGDERIDVRWLKPPSRRCYWADPSLTVDVDGSLWIFLEEFPIREGNGRIVAVRHTPGGVTDIKTVLEDEHHRALPRVQRVADRWLATVDTCQSPAPVFTFERLGQPWRPLPGAFLPPFAVDPMLSRNGDDWSVILTNWTLDEGSACETWHSHGGPPFDWHRDDSLGFADPVRGRGAGQLDTVQGIRAVQDCSWGYGLKTSLVRLKAGPEGRPQSLATLLPQRLSGRRWENTHTLAWVPKSPSEGSVEGPHYVVLDAGWSKVDVSWPFLRKRELQHLKACRSASLASASPQDL